MAEVTFVALLSFAEVMVAVASRGDAGQGVHPYHPECQGLD